MQLNNMLAKLRIASDTLHADTEKILINVFDDDVNLGRLFTVVAFCSVLAERCVKMEFPISFLKLSNGQLHFWISAACSGKNGEHGRLTALNDTTKVSINCNQFQTFSRAL